VAVNRTVESKNKALVLEAFDTLFNKHNYAAAEKFWSPQYLQHSAHIAPGREGLCAGGDQQWSSLPRQLPVLYSQLVLDRSTTQ
jgi:predicted SnoaL-like aldol condensation-catalyzing enzyme